MRQGGANYLFGEAGGVHFFSENGTHTTQFFSENGINTTSRK
jgi:hypothetical protein